jgi:streptomycin 6-kinase
VEICCDDGAMQPLRVLDPSFRARVLRHEPGAAAWMDTVPEVARDACRRWSLTQVGEPRYGGTSLVIPVSGAVEGPAVLKLVSPLADPSTEVRALTVLAGHGTVRLLRSHEESGTLLLERLPGPSLAEHDDRLEAARIAARVARRIASVPAPSDAPRLRLTSSTWLLQLREQHATAVAAGNALPEATFRRAERSIEALASDATDTLTHSDLSLENILRREDGTWCAIDPGYLCAPVENEAHTVLRSMLAELMATPDPRAALGEVVEEFSDAAQADSSRAWELSVTRFVASYYWESQHGGDPANVEHLRRAAHLAD